MLGRILKTTAAIAAVAAAGGFIYYFRLWERDWSTIDDGWGSLIGSAIGAYLAVVGALYVSKAEERRKKKAFEDFVRVAVQNLVVQASYLEAMAWEPHKVGRNNQEQFGTISIQVRNLTDALAVFDREIAHSKDGDYDLRRGIIALDAMLAETRHAFSINTEPVQAFHTWHVGAYQVRYHASHVLHAHGWMVPMPSSTLIGERIKELITTWRNWNIPTEAAPVPAVRSIHPTSQTLHHAHA